MIKIKTVSVVLVLILLMSVFTACGKSREEVLAGFNELIPVESVADKEEGHRILSEMESYLDSNLRYVDDEDADYMFFNYLEEAFRIDNEYISYAEVTERYGNYLSDLMNALLVIEIEDEINPLTEGEGVLRCDWNEVAQRALLAESVISEHRETIDSDAYAYLKEHILWHYEYYINLMLMGTSNNPVFAYQTGEFDENASAMYESTAQENPETVVAWAINEYFTYLDSVDYKLDYNDAKESKVFYDTCSYIKTEAGKRVGK
ncbi:MAG: hypothetical protein IJC14_00415 [Firmicutes bacterium]|nr:hypothetical protein [Bacillota bacterium]